VKWVLDPRALTVQEGKPDGWDPALSADNVGGGSVKPRGLFISQTPHLWLEGSQQSGAGDRWNRDGISGQHGEYRTSHAIDYRHIWLSLVGPDLEVG
jgi:hypothetical protein